MHITTVGVDLAKLAKPDIDPALRVRFTDEAPTSEFHQEQRPTPQPKFGCMAAIDLQRITAQTLGKPEASM